MTVHATRSGEAKEAPKKVGRPSSFNWDMANRILERVAAGEGLTVLCKEKGYPEAKTVYRWMEANEEFRHAYARAKERTADLYADEIVRIADEEEDPNRARVRIDARKWAAAKLAPKKYGDAKAGNDVSVTLSLGDLHLQAVKMPVVDVTPVAQPMLAEAMQPVQVHQPGDGAVLIEIQPEPPSA